MDYKADYLSVVKERVSAHRYNHTLGVIKEAIFLSKIYNVDPDKARIAASLHDISKNKDKDEMLKNIKKYYPPSILDYPINTLHSFDAVIEAKHLGVDDLDILKAIESHALGRPNMSTLEKIIYIADFSEEGREFKEARIAHEIALKSLDKAVYYIITTIKEHEESKGNITPQICLDAIKFYKDKE